MAILLSAMGLIFLALLGRLFVLQIVNGQQCRDAYEQSLLRGTFFTASRGAILDRHGNVLARDNLSYEFCMDYRLIAEDPSWVRTRQRELRRQLRNTADSGRAEEIFAERMDKSLYWAVQACGSSEQFDAVRRQIVARVKRIAEINNDRPREAEEFHVIAQIGSEERYRYLKEMVEGLPGVSVRHGRKRDYPAGEYACHVIGQIGPVSREDLAAHNLTEEQEPDAFERRLANYQPTDIIGKSGVEKLCERMLRPAQGYESTGGGVQKLRIDPHDGRDVHLTIDMALQVRLTEMFRKTYPYHNGCIAVMDVATGEILAMVSIPTYNLQTYRRRVSEEAAQAAAASPPRRNSREWIDRPYGLLVKDDFDFPLMNRVIAGRYDPGSTFKPLIAAAALTEGIIDIHRTIECRGRLFENSPGYGCTGTHGFLLLAEAIRCSCNIYFYRVGEWMYHRDANLLPEWLGRFGMFDLPGTGLVEEKAGVMDMPTGAERRGASRMLAIGQKTSVTPLHVVNLMATIARNGEMISPTIVRPGEGGPEPVRVKLPIAREHMAEIREGMRRVTARYGGTAYKVWNTQGGRQLGFEVCGKSGTARVAGGGQFRTVIHEDGTRRREMVREGNMVWFAGFAPAKNPQVAFVAMVEYVIYQSGSDPDEYIEGGLTGGGATVAGPLCIEVLKACKELGYIRGE
ncbi:MAG: penicillin-binding transpeptidase domain-containing protein [Phycisphaerae bacterium]|nr:penicillin-binding transpeptidase domain-containing protein [Phycisphaerae bacterium]